MKKLVSYIVLSLMLLLFQHKAIAQRGVYDTLRVSAYISPEGDTIPEAWLPTVEVKSIMTTSLKNYWQNWTRLRNAVYVTYPYALRASMVINEVNAALYNVKDEKQRNQIIRAREKELKRDFADKVTNLSVYQGKVLMKLINRETGNNCYELVKEYKGGFNAGLWQTVAFLFGSSLKQKYDPKGDDQEMEKFVQEVRKLYGYRS